MHPAVRTQNDQSQELYSTRAAELLADEMAESKDTARQEYGDEANINKLLARFGVHTPVGKVTFGEVDYSVNLQDAFQAIADAKEAHRRLPADLKTDYPTWQALLNAIEAGAIRIKTEADKPPTAEGTNATTGQQSP